MLSYLAFSGTADPRCQAELVLFPVHWMGGRESQTQHMVNNPSATDILEVLKHLCVSQSLYCLQCNREHCDSTFPLPKVNNRCGSCKYNYKKQEKIPVNQKAHSVKCRSLKCLRMSFINYKVKQLKKGF